MKKYFILILGIVMSLNAYSQDFQSNLLKDIVVVSGEKYTSNFYRILTHATTPPINSQFKCYAEAPVSAISRDNFVAFVILTTQAIIASYAEEFNPSISPTDEIIGNPDAEINLFIGKTGLQIEIKDSNGTKRETKKWSDL